MLNVIYTYESVLPASEGELKSYNVATVPTVEEARELILAEYDMTVGRLDDDGEGGDQIDWLADHMLKHYTIEAAVAA